MTLVFRGCNDEQNANTKKQHTHVCCRCTLHVCFVMLHHQRSLLKWHVCNCAVRNAKSVPEYDADLSEVKWLYPHEVRMQSSCLWEEQTGVLIFWNGNRTKHRAPSPTPTVVCRSETVGLCNANKLRCGRGLAFVDRKLLRVLHRL